MRLIDRIKRKMAIRHNGIPIFFLVYRPQKDGKNVMASMIHPDIKGDMLLDQLLSAVGERIRLYYSKHPELLQEALNQLKEANNE